MKNIFYLLLTSIFISACISEKLFPLKIDPRFKINSYTAIDDGSDDFSGLLMLVSTNVVLKSDTIDNNSDFEYWILMREACLLHKIDQVTYSSNCFDEGGNSQVTLDGNNANNGAYHINSTEGDFTHLSGSYQITVQESDGSLASMDFEMVKIAVSNTSIGQLTLDDTISIMESNIYEFMEISQVVNLFGIAGMLFEGHEIISETGCFKLNLHSYDTKEENIDNVITGDCNDSTIISALPTANDNQLLLKRLTSKNHDLTIKGLTSENTTAYQISVDINL